MHVALQLGRLFERQRSAHALRATRRACGAEILENMPIGVYVLDAAGALLRQQVRPRDAHGDRVLRPPRLQARRQQAGFQ